MRIFHCLMSREFAGTERHVSELAAWQAGQGHEVHVLLKEQSAEMVARWRAACGKKVQFHFLPGWWPKRLAGVWSFVLARKLKPDVAHCHLGRAARYMGRGLQWAGVKVVGTLHLRYRDKDAAHLDALIAIAGWQVPEISARYKGLTPVVIWNWVAEKGGKKVTRKKGGAFTFVSVGRLVPQKGMDVLAKAFCKAFPKDKDVRLVVVGEGGGRREVEDAVGGDERVELAGYQADVAKFYGEADCFVSAARYEPFGLVILEAMAHGLPLVCTNTEGPSEFLADYPVLWAEKGDVDSMVVALRDARKAKLGRVDYDMAPFSMEKAGRAIEEVYRKVTA